MCVCVIEFFETITRDSGAQLDGGEGEVSRGLLAKLEKSSVILEKNAGIYSSIGCISHLKCCF